ncbi:hypothetical protein F3Y22_tig00002511pilonHSYRG00524 [Hibiscus syriacus]|uniref:Uncharacterized protein n=1 Tax=Hibiscus syriacus TaxID=106335 RepID=A0A6A3CTN6_HIBSY|nr:hypothetical protein F3Y22_tig00002511pilonHSYRG00524 [Hibiscus syriacus]
MRGHRPFRPHGGYPPSQPSFGPQNPNFPLQHPNVLQFLQTQPNFALQQNPNNFFFQNPFPYSLPQNPNITTQQPPQQLFNNPRSSQSQLHNQRGSATSGQVPREVQERINQAVNQAWQGLMASRNSVTAWKVSQAALVELQADSWSSLGLDMQGVPSLQKLMTIEGRVNAFIQCFVGVRKITTLYELEMEICKNEGVRTYEKLELGPFLCHPLVLHYFSLNSNCKKVFKITSEDVIAHLHEYMDSHNNQEILIDEFLGFVADKQAATSKEELGVRIQSLAYVFHIFLLTSSRKILMHHQKPMP